MYQQGGDQIAPRIAEAVEPERFVDEADLGDVVIRTTYRLQPAEAGRIQITLRGKRLAPRAIAAVEQVDAGFFQKIRPEDPVGFLRKLARFPETQAGLA